VSLVEDAVKFLEEGFVGLQVWLELEWKLKVAELMDKSISVPNAPF
jgi:hypothetical protein